MSAIGIKALGRLASIMLLGVAPVQAQIRVPAPVDTAQAVHLLQRATYGIQAGDLAEVLSIGPEAWLERQLFPERIPEPVLEEVLSEYPAALLPGSEVFRLYTPRSQAQRGMAGGTSQEDAARERQREAAQGRARVMRELVSARLQRAVHSERQLQEVMVGFWLDHFNIFLNKGPVRWLTADYERNAIRPHVFATFEELLVAVATHPTMLIYLDNWQSTAEGQSAARLARGNVPAGATSRPARSGMAGVTPRPNGVSRPGGGVRIGATTGLAERPGDDRGGQQVQARRRGINENYARELLELHTLGVAGGYTQQDVIEVARAFTGWSVTPPRGLNGGDAYEFVFRPAMHDRGEKEVLGLQIPAGGGQEEGLAVLRMLARHPATARHISWKLVERFVSDDPPVELVDTLTAAFLRTGGDLREVTRTLFTSPVFRDPAHRGAKIKRPLELVVSTLRATDADVVATQGILQTLRTFGQVPYLEAAPAGYPSQKADWVNSGAMLNRMNFGLDIGSGRVRGVRLPREGWWQAAVRAGSREEMVAGLAQHFLPGVETGELESIILADLAGVEGKKPEELAGRALGLILGSPEFQRH